MDSTLVRLLVLVKGAAMRTSGAPSWQIDSGFEGLVTLALYVRDAFELGRYVSAQPDFPRLQPTVSPRPVPADVAEAARQWERWWPRVLTASTHHEAPFGSPFWLGLEPDLEDLPVLRTLVEQCREEFDRWSGQLQLVDRETAESGMMTLVSFVNGYEAKLGRAVRPFRLSLREVPVAGRHGWSLAPGVVALSTDLLNDESGLVTFLEPLIDQLA